LLVGEQADPKVTRGHSRLSGRVRAIALLAVGDLVVHQGRYMLGYGDGWRQILHNGGHEYLVLLVPLVLAMLAVAVGLFVAEARDVSRDPLVGTPIRPPSFLRTWLFGFLVLCSVYTLQETCEGLLSGHHAAGFTGLLASRGWIAFALAVAAAAVIALLQRGAAAVLARASRSERLAVRPRPVWLPTNFTFPRARPVGRNLAPRGPPAGLL
jgi:hypothetical protein